MVFLFNTPTTSSYFVCAFWERASSLVFEYLFVYISSLSAQDTPLHWLQSPYILKCHLIILNCWKIDINFMQRTGVCKSFKKMISISMQSCKYIFCKQNRIIREINNTTMFVIQYLLFKAYFIRSTKYHSTLSLFCKDIICFCNYRDMLPRAELLFKLCLKMKSRFSDDKLFLFVRRRSFLLLCSVVRYLISCVLNY